MCGFLGLKSTLLRRRIQEIVEKRAELIAVVTQNANHGTKLFIVEIDVDNLATQGELSFDIETKFNKLEVIIELKGCFQKPFIPWIGTAVTVGGVLDQRANLEGKKGVGETCFQRVKAVVA